MTPKVPSIELEGAAISAGITFCLAGASRVNTIHTAAEKASVGEKRKLDLTS